MDHNLQALLAVAISGALCRVAWVWAVELPFSKRRSPIDRAENQLAIGRGVVPSQFEEKRFQSHNLSVGKGVIHNKKVHNGNCFLGANTRSNIDLSMSGSARQRELEPCPTGFVRVRPQRATMPLKD